MENTLKKINLNYFVVYLNLTQHCKSTILQFNKKLPFKTSKAEESLKVKQNKTNSSQVCKCWFLTIIDDIPDCNLLVHSRYGLGNSGSETVTGSSKWPSEALRACPLSESRRSGLRPKVLAHGPALCLCTLFLPIIVSKTSFNFIDGMFSDVFLN